MKRYELDAEQQILLERSFMSVPPRDGWQMKFELINEKLLQVAKNLMQVTPKGPEQTLAMRKLQEAQYWFEQAIKKIEI